MRQKIISQILVLGIIGAMVYIGCTYLSPSTNFSGTASTIPNSANSVVLDHDEFAYTYSTASQCDRIFWSFSSSVTTVGIYVMAMNLGNYSRFTSSNSYTYNALSTGGSYSDSGYFRPNYYDTWYIVFFNNGTTVSTTTLTYTTSSSTNFYCTFSMADSYEEDDSFSSAYTISTDILYRRTATDDDYFKIYLYSGNTFTASINWSSSSTDLDLYLYSSSYSQLTSNITSYSISVSVSYAIPTTGYYYLRMVHSSGVYISYTLTTSISSSDDTYEPNDSFATAYSISDIANLYSLTAADDDYYKVYLTSGDYISISLSWSSSSTDLDLYLYDSSYNLLDFDVYSYETSASVSDTVDSSGYYYIKVSKASGSAITYSLSSNSYSTSDPNWGFFDLFTGALLFFIIAMIVVNIAIMVWLYKDANSRGMSGGLWLLLTFFFGLIALIIYLIIRKPKLTVFNPNAGAITNAYSARNSSTPYSANQFNSPNAQTSFYTPGAQIRNNTPNTHTTNEINVNSTQNANQSKKICSLCGVPNDSSGRFCTGCGKEL